MPDIDAQTPVLSDRDFAFYTTMNDVLQMAIGHGEKARHADDDYEMFVHLKMLATCVKCALEIYGDRLRRYNKEEVK